MKALTLLLGAALAVAYIPSTATAQPGIAIEFNSDGANVILGNKPKRKYYKKRHWGNHSEAPVVVKRRYDSRSNTVYVEREGGGVDELPYVGLPVHFVKGSTELRNERSARNVSKLARTLKHILRRDPSARFEIQGHASADGDASYNYRLSQERARWIRRILVREYGVPRYAVQGVGFGEEYARYPHYAPEHELRRDRRVLVVRYE